MRSFEKNFIVLGIAWVPYDSVASEIELRPTLIGDEIMIEKRHQCNESQAKSH